MDSCNFDAAVLRPLLPKLLHDRVRRNPFRVGTDTAGVDVSDQRAGDGVSLLLRQTHIQIVAGTVGVAHHIDGGLDTSFSTIATPVSVLVTAGFSVALPLSKVTLFGIFRMILSPLRVNANARAPHFAAAVSLPVRPCSNPRRRPALPLPRQSARLNDLEEESALDACAVISDPSPAPMPDLPARVRRCSGLLVQPDIAAAPLTMAANRPNVLMLFRI